MADKEHVEKLINEYKNIVQELTDARISDDQLAGVVGGEDEGRCNFNRTCVPDAKPNLCYQACTLSSEII